MVLILLFICCTKLSSFKYDDWERFFIEAGISTDSAKTHATKFADEKLTIKSLQMLDRSMLKELGVTLMREFSTFMTDRSLLTQLITLGYRN